MTKGDLIIQKEGLWTFLNTIKEREEEFGVLRLKTLNVLTNILIIDREIERIIWNNQSNYFGFYIKDKGIIIVYIDKTGRLSKSINF